MSAEIEGWLTDGQAARLRAAAAGQDHVVEIGSFRGKSTIELARVASGTVVAIDPHLGSDRGPQEFDVDTIRGDDDYTHFHRNLAEAGVAERVHHVRLRSEEAHPAVDGPIDVLYVDGAHRYGPALADIRDWGARVRPGGTMLVHDSFSSIGVTLALLRSVIFSRGWRYKGRSRSLAEWERSPAGPLDALRALASLPWFAWNVVLKVLILAGLRPGPWPY